MKIKHLPNSISPYENCGYCRVPEKPVEGEEIILYCLVEDTGEGMVAPNLKLVVNNEIIISPVKPKHEKSEEKGEYYSFSIGTYQTGDILTYQFCCLSEELEYDTDWYEFEICKSEVFQTPSRIYYDENTLLLQFLSGDETNFQMRIELMENQIHVKMEQKNTAFGLKQNLNLSKIWSKEFYKLKVDIAPFSLLIYNKEEELLMQIIDTEHQISLLTNKERKIKNVSWQFNLKAKGLFGFGEKFNRVNQLELEAKTYVYEHFTHQEEKTYLPIPFFFTEAGLGVFYDTDYSVNFTSKKKGEMAFLSVEAVTNRSDELDDFKLFFGEPQDLLKQYIDNTGKCLLPPKWSFGPWMSANGWNTQKETLEQIDLMKQHQIPATVLVLEAWSDETTFYLFNDVKYDPKSGAERLSYEDMSFDENGKWPDPKGMTQTLHDNNVKLVLWQVPVIKFMEADENIQHSNDENHVIQMGYCVRDKEGRPYRIPDKWFTNSLVPDFTNQEAKEWWFSKRRYLLEEVGIDGFKTDGAEFIYDNQSVFANGKYGEELRNPYPNLYLEGYHEFLSKYKGEGNGVLFSRAGYTGAQRYPIHWAGDQMSEYTEFRAQVKAGLSAGLSGVIFWGFDIAGFAGDLPTTDLFLRSTAMAAFSPIMQFHSEPRTGQFFYEERRSWNNDRSPWNMAEVNKEPEILQVYRKFANIRMNLMPYIYNEAIHCSEYGRPMFAHLILDYPMDEKVVNIEDEYLFGRSLLIAPVIYEGATSRNVYLPEGNWFEFFTGKKYEGGKELVFECPLGEIPVFVKEGHAIVLNLSDSGKIADYIGNNLEAYQNFAVKLYGAKGKVQFQDDLGHNFTLEWGDMNKTWEGIVPDGIIVI